MTVETLFWQQKIRVETIALLTLFNIGISGGMSIQTVSPNLAGGTDYSYHVYNSIGRDYALTVFGDLTSTMRYNARLTYNQNSTEVYHWLRTSNERQQTMNGFMSHSSLGLMLVPEYHIGKKAEVYCGAGLYAGAMVNSGFSGTAIYINKNDTNRYNLTNQPDESFRSVSSAFVISAGMRLPIYKNVKLSIDADFLRFFKAKNLIFQDTGTTNEINLKAGIIYGIPRKQKDK